MVAGKWKVVIKSPIGGIDASMDFTEEGENLFGSVEANGNSAEITKGKVNGDEFVFNVNLKTPIGAIGFRVTGKVDGDTVEGKAKMAMGVSEFSGTRVM